MTYSWKLDEKKDPFDPNQWSVSRNAEQKEAGKLLVYRGERFDVVDLVDLEDDEEDDDPFLVDVFFSVSK